MSTFRVLFSWTGVCELVSVSYNVRCCSCSKKMSIHGVNACDFKISTMLVLTLLFFEPSLMQVKVACIKTLDSSIAAWR
jgi:hypothetical protein